MGWGIFFMGKAFISWVEAFLSWVEMNENFNFTIYLEYSEKKILQFKLQITFYLPLPCGGEWSLSWARGRNSYRHDASTNEKMPQPMKNYLNPGKFSLNQWKKFLKLNFRIYKYIKYKQNSHGLKHFLHELMHLFHGLMQNFHRLILGVTILV